MPGRWHRTIRETAAQAVARATLLQRGLIGVSVVALALAGVWWHGGRVRARRASARLAAVQEPVEAVAPGADDLLVMCATCTRVRGAEGDWLLIATKLRQGTGKAVSHGICPACEQRILTAATEDPDLLELLGAGPPTPECQLRGGFDWPPSDDELARVVRADSQATQERAGRGGHW